MAQDLQHTTAGPRLLFPHHGILLSEPQFLPSQDEVRT